VRHDPQRIVLQGQQALPARKALRRLRPPDDLAEKMGEDLGRGEVLLGRLPPIEITAGAAHCPFFG
jgi:hypothetical protein